MGMEQRSDGGDFDGRQGPKRRREAERGKESHDGQGAGSSKRGRRVLLAR